MWGTSRFPSRLSPTVVADSVREVCLAKDKKEFLPWNPDETFWQLPFCRCDWMTSKFPLSSMSLWNSKRCHYSEQLLPIKKLLNLVLCSPRAALRKGLVSRHETRSPGCCWEALSPALLFYWAEKTQLRKRQHPPHTLSLTTCYRLQELTMGCFQRSWSVEGKQHAHCREVQTNVPIWLCRYRRYRLWPALVRKKTVTGIY